MKNRVHWWSVGLLSVALWASCSSESKTQDEGGDGDAGASVGGAISGGGGGASGSANGGSANGGSSSGTGGTSGDAGAGAEGGRGGGAGEDGEGGTSGAAGGGDSGEGGSSGAGGSGAGAGGRGGAGTGSGGDAGTSPGAGNGGMGGSGGCVGLECQVQEDNCPSNSRTTLVGTVYAPNGTLPIYNARVYVPRSTATLPAIADTVACRTCSSPLSAAPVAVTLSDTSGAFRLSGVPSGTNVPLVIELGKWRRAVTIATVTKCVENPSLSAELTRLPRNSAEGHIPRIAITTGRSDALECLPWRLGIAENEIGTDGSLARVHLFAGGDGTNSFALGGNFAPATALWSNRAKLMTYDAVMMSCEGSTSEFRDQKPQTSIDNLTAYADAGGRILYNHLHVYWLQNMLGYGATANYIGNLDPPPSPATFTVNQAFPKGAALAQWLQGVGATTTAGELSIIGSEHSVTAVTSPTVEWLSMTNPNNGQHSSQALSFNTPLTDPEAQQCGRNTFVDLHVKPSVTTTAGTTGGDDSDPSKPFPTGCSSRDMSPQQKAAAFLFFDLTGCVQPNGATPSVP